MKKMLIFSLLFAINIFGYSERTIRYNAIALPTILDPQIVNDNTSGEILSYIFEGLTRLDSKGKPIPGVAESWSNKDNVWTFKLRKTAKWHNGESVTANDFLEAWERVLNPATGSPFSYIIYCIKGAKEYNEGAYKSFSEVGIKAIDRYTLQVILKESVVYFPSLVSHFILYPQNTKFFNQIGNELYGTSENTILGNGPYQLTYMDEIEGLLLKKSQDYWDRNNIKIDVLDFTVFDEKIAYEKYNENLLDIIEFYDENSNDLKTFEDGSVWYLGLNTNNRLLSNKKIRKALSMSIDRELLIKDVKNNLGSIAESFVPNGIVGKKDFFRVENNQSTYGISYNPTKARELFDEGLKELNINKQDLESLKFLTGSWDIAVNESNFYVNQIKMALGIDIMVESVPFETRIQRTSEGDYDIVLAGWGLDYNDPMTFLELWTSNSGENNTGWRNTKYDELIQKAKEETDNDKRFDILGKIEKMLMEELPIIPTFYRNRAVLIKPNISNVQLSSFIPSVNLLHSKIDYFIDSQATQNNFIEDIENSTEKLENILKLDSVENFKKYIKENKIQVSEKGIEILELSVIYDSIDIFTYLVSEGVDIWDENTQFSLAIRAIENDSIGIFEYFIKNGFDKNIKINIGNIEGVSLLYCAVKNNSPLVLNYLLKEGLNIHEKYDNNKNLLMLAAENNNLEVVDTLIRNGIDIEERNNYKNNAVLISAYYNSIDVLNFLLEEKAKIDEKNLDGDTAIMLAIRNNSLEAVDILIDKGADLREKNKKMISPLKESINLKKFEIVKKLLDNGVVLDNDEKKDNSSIFKAISSNDVDMLKALIDLGINVNNLNSDGISPLSFTKSEEMEKILIEAGANKSEEIKFKMNKLNYQRLEEAIKNNNLELVEVLVTQVDISKPNNFLNIAKSNEVIDILLGNHCYTEYVENNYDGSKMTLLLKAVEENNYLLFKKLIENGANRDALNGNGEGLIDYSYHDKPEILEYLIKNNIITFEKILNSKEINNLICFHYIKNNVKNIENIRKIFNVSNKKDVLIYATNDNNDEVLNTIISINNDMSIYSSETILSLVRNGNFGTTKKLLEMGVSLSSYSNQPTPLYYAVKMNRKDLVELLLKYGDTVEQKSTDEQPLVLALKDDNVKILKILLEYSTEDINRKNYYYEGRPGPLLYHATVHDYINSVKLLLSLGAKSMAYEDQSILNIAVANSSYNTIEYLLKNGYTVNSASKDGITPLMTATANNNIEMINYLLTKKANIYAKTKGGKGIMFFAKNPEIRKIFADKGLKE